MANSDFGLIELDYIDSTNNYAMRLIDDDKAHQGLTVVARSQDSGRGQRGRTWKDEPGKSLLMSVVTYPKRPLTDQFVFSCSIASAIANVLQKMFPELTVRIKWPNDIIIGDKKAGGMLIENVLRGSTWAQSVVGLGVNVNQEKMPGELPFATSLFCETGRETSIGLLRDRLRAHIMSAVLYPAPAGRVMEQYNELLFKRGETQLFNVGGAMQEGTVLCANDDGTLKVHLDSGGTVNYQHGQAGWIWG